jgi:hypothetical protein
MSLATRSEPDDEDQRRPAIERLLEQARQKMIDRRFQAALGLLDDAQRLDPDRLETTLLKALCLLGLRQPERALALVDEAGLHAHRMEDTPETCRREVTEGFLEEARQRLRRGDPRGALKYVRPGIVLLPGDAHVQEVHQYTALRLTSDTGDKLVWQKVAPRERVIRWLVREELTSAEKALGEQKFDDAIRICRAAADIDKRGTRLALVTAHAVFGQVLAATPRPDLAAIDRQLTSAEKLLDRAAADPSLKPECDHLREAIAAVRLPVRQGREAEKRWQPIMDLWDRLERIGKAYSTYVSRIQADNIKASMAQIVVDARRLMSDYPTGSEEAKDLQRLLDAIEKQRRQLS